MEFNRYNREYQLKKKINQLWSDIADFETREIKHDPNNLPRENARMEAYEKLQDNLITVSESRN